MSNDRRRHSALAVLAAVPATTAATAAAATTTPPRLRGRPSSSAPPPRRSERRRGGRRRAETVETNDDDRTVIPLLPFSFELSDLPPASPLLAPAPDGGADGGAGGSLLAATTAPEMDELLEHVGDLGARAFGESALYRERFYEWDVGSRWSAGGARASPPRVEWFDDAEAGPSLPWGEAEIGRSSDPSGTTSSTILLTLGHNGTVAFKGVYWADDPSSEELTEFLVREMNSDANREGLLEKLRPLACSPGDLAAQECNVALEVVRSDVTEESEPVDEEAAAVEEGVDAEYATTAEHQVFAELGPPADDTNGGEEVDNNPPADGAQDVTTAVAWSNLGATGPSDTLGGEVVGEDGTAAIPTDPAMVDTSTNSLEAIPSDSRYAASVSSVRAASQEGSEDETPLQMIVPVVIGAALLALLVAGLLYRRRRERRRRAAAAAREEELDATDDTIPAEFMSPTAASSAYDTITGSKTRSASRTGDSSTTAATAGASVAAASPAATAAGASAPWTPAKSASKTLDDVLNSFSDGDSSFVSDSTASGTTGHGGGANAGSVLSGLSDLLSSSPTVPKRLPPEETIADRIAAVKQRLEDSADSSRLDEGAADAGGAPSAGVRKPEDFEGTYRTRSAMAKLNLRKDILHVACETHDAPSDGGDDDDGSRAALLPEQRALGDGYGVARTISPRKSASMTERQRAAERLSLRTRSRYFASRPGGVDGEGGGPDGRRDDGVRRERKRKEEERKRREREERETSKDLMLPVGFRRSDSVDLTGKGGDDGGASEASSEDDIGGGDDAGYV